MKARAYYRRYLRHTANPNVIALEKIDRDTIDSAGSWGQKSLMWQFENIDTIGSLMKVTPDDCAAIHLEENSLFGTKQKILKKQAEYLSRQYHCVVTNPPYLGKGMGDPLKNYIKEIYPNSKADTMATFMERCINFCCDKGKMSMINMQSWMFLSSFEKMRYDFIEKYHIDSLLHLGAHAFDEIGGEVVQSTSFVFAKHLPHKGTYYRLVAGNNSTSKETSFLKRENEYSNIEQTNFKFIPGCITAYWISDAMFELFKKQKVSSLTKGKSGQNTGDNNRFVRSWYEIGLNRINFSMKSENEFNPDFKWIPYNKGGEFRRWAGNYDYVVNWGNDGEEIKEYAVIRNNGKHWSRYIQNLDCLYKEGITWSIICSSTFSMRYLPTGFICDYAGCALFPKSTDLTYLLGLFNTKFVDVILKVLNPTINCQPGNVGSIPLIFDDKEHIDSIVKSSINISTDDWNAHETSWDFQRNPLWEQQLDTILYDMQERSVLSGDAGIDDIGPFNLPDLLQPLEVLVENYKSEWEDHFYTLHHNEEELNRKFIKIYGLQDELTPDVPLDEITILQKGEISIEDNKIVWHDDVIIKQFISYLVGCLMGRYSVDKPGLIIASQGQKVADLNLPAHTIEIDDDGIIPVIMEEDFFADDLTQRIETAVKTLFGERDFYENMKYIKATLGMNLRDYLYKNYYVDHQQMYSVKGAKRPIYWLFSSQMGEKKKKGHFKALVYMHRLESDTLSKLHADYVYPYLTKVEQQLREAEDNATRDDLSQTQHNKAMKLAEELKEKVREVKTFETQLVEMASARITIDLDDGVKANYPKFYPLVEPIKGLDSKDE